MNGLHAAGRAGDAVMHHICQSEAMHDLSKALTPNIHPLRKRKVHEEQLQEHVDVNHHLDDLARDLYHAHRQLDRASDANKMDASEKAYVISQRFRHAVWGPERDYYKPPQSQRSKIMTLPLSAKRPRFGFLSSNSMEDVRLDMHKADMDMPSGDGEVVSK